MALREITHYALDVAYAPEDVIKTLVDFSDRRPLIWRETSHPEVYLRRHPERETAPDHPHVNGIVAAHRQAPRHRTRDPAARPAGRWRPDPQAAAISAGGVVALSLGSMPPTVTKSLAA